MDIRRLVLSRKTDSYWIYLYLHFKLYAMLHSLTNIFEEWLTWDPPTGLWFFLCCCYRTVCVRYTRHFQVLLNANSFISPQVRLGALRLSRLAEIIISFFPFPQVATELRLSPPHPPTRKKNHTRDYSKGLPCFRTNWLTNILWFLYKTKFSKLC